VTTREMPTPLTTVATLLYSPPSPWPQVACAVIEEALEHGLATKISRKEVSSSSSSNSSNSSSSSKVVVAVAMISRKEV